MVFYQGDNNPFGPTGGNPMVKTIEVAGTPYWSFYIPIFGSQYPNGVTFDIHKAVGRPFSSYEEYNDAWDAMYNFYTQPGVGFELPEFDMIANGFDLGNADVPGFTFSDPGLQISAEPPKLGGYIPPGSP